MNEFLIIKKYLKRLAKKNKSALNLSDDIFFDYKKRIAISIDTFVEGKHFIDFKKPNLVIKKTLRASISDIICKGINPKYYFFSFSGNKKHFTKKNLRKISLALKNEQKSFNITLSGGDIIDSKKLSITIAVVGYSKSNPILRCDAKINDDIYLTNTVGDAFLGLQILKNKIKVDRKKKNYFVNKFYLPSLPIKLANKIHLFANSSIDVSDGIFQDLGHILSQSNLSSKIFYNKIPISRHLNNFLKKSKKNKLSYISNGDDYQILFTANKAKRNIIKKISQNTSTKITKIGIVKSKSTSKNISLVNGKHKLPQKMGYIHSF